MEEGIGNKWWWKKISLKKNKIEYSAQDAGVSKQSLPLHTTTEKLQLDYKTSITHNHQKIKMYGSLTTKELKKSHSSRRVGGLERQGKAGRYGWVVPHTPGCG